MQKRSILFIVILLAALICSCVPMEQKQSDSSKAEYHYILGVTSLNEKNPTEALKEFLEAQKYDAANPDIQAGLAQAYWLKKAYPLAEKHFKNAIQLSENEPKYYNNLGALYLSIERHDEAIAAFEKAADNLLFDRPEVAWTGIGMAHVQKQDYQAAQIAYQKAIGINPRYYMAPFRLGELYYNQDRPVEALEMFQKSVSLAPGFANGYYWQGLVYMKMKDTKSAKESFAKVVKLAPDSDVSRLATNYLKIIGK